MPNKTLRTEENWKQLPSQTCISESETETDHFVSFASSETIFRNQNPFTQIIRQPQNHPLNHKAITSQGHVCLDFFEDGSMMMKNERMKKEIISKDLKWFYNRYFWLKILFGFLFFLISVLSINYVIQNFIQMDKDQNSLKKEQSKLNQVQKQNQGQVKQNRITEIENQSVQEKELDLTKVILNRKEITQKGKQSLKQSFKLVQTVLPGKSQKQIHHSFPSSRASLILENSLKEVLVLKNKKLSDLQQIKPILQVQQVHKKEHEELIQKTQNEINPTENPTFIQSMSCAKYRNSLSKKYGQLYQFSNTHQQFIKQSSADLFQYRPTLDITQSKFSEAIDLLELIHHVTPQGHIEVENAPCQNVDTINRRLTSAMDKQYWRLNETYQINYYHSRQFKFCIVTNSYRNAEKGLIYRNIDSILQQNYTNYHVVYTDDASPDGTGQKVIEYLKKKNVSENKFKVKTNQGQVGMMENIFNAITYDCELGEIVVMLDGDDSFIGTNVLSLLNALYQKHKVALIWNNFVQIQQNRRAGMGYSKDLEQQDKVNNYFRKKDRFVSSHLKSFYVDVFCQIQVRDLKYDDGRFYGGASDTAMMLSMIEMVYPFYRYVPQIVYEYRFDTRQEGMRVNKQAQQSALTKISLTRRYKTLQSFWFIDLAILNLMKVQN